MGIFQPHQQEGRPPRSARVAAFIVGERPATEEGRKKDPVDYARAGEKGAAAGVSAAEGDVVLMKPNGEAEKLSLEDFVRDYRPIPGNRGSLDMYRHLRLRVAAGASPPSQGGDTGGGDKPTTSGGEGGDAGGSTEANTKAKRGKTK